MDLVQYMQNGEGWRLCGAANFTHNMDDWTDGVKGAVIEPTYERGFQHAKEPDEVGPIPQSNHGLCAQLVRHAVQELGDEFTLDEVLWLMEGSGFERNRIMANLVHAARKGGYRSQKLPNCGSRGSRVKYTR